MTDPTDQSGLNPDAQNFAQPQNEISPLNNEPSDDNHPNNNDIEQNDSQAFGEPDPSEPQPFEAIAEQDFSENIADDEDNSLQSELEELEDDIDEDLGAVEQELAEARDEFKQAGQSQPKGKSAQRSRQPAEPAGPTVVARYGVMRYIGEFSHNLKTQPMPGRKIVVRTDRGVELAEVVAAVHRNPDTHCGPRAIHGENLKKFLKNSGPEYPFRRTGRVMRLANPQDEVDFRHLEASAKEEGKYCRQEIKKANLPMRLVTVEHMLGGERIVFYFTSESRVDFRDLVRDLASQFRTRIEMRQVGARDEARLVGDYERCGQRCCCQEFLKHLKPVSMRMAKVQKATLDPSKISGRCGRLMCCLRYEDEAYDELRKNLPRRNSWVRTKDYLGKVLDTQIITQLVRLVLPDNTYIAVSVNDLIERDMQPPSEDQLKNASARHAAIRREAVAAPPPPSFDFPSSAFGRDDTGEVEEELQTADATGTDVPFEAQPEKTPGEQANKKRRRSRRRKKPSGGQAEASQQQNRQQRQKPAEGQRQTTDKAASSDSTGLPAKKKRRRRRRKKPGQGGQNSQSNSGNTPSQGE